MDDINAENKDLKASGLSGSGNRIFIRLGLIAVLFPAAMALIIAAVVWGLEVELSRNSMKHIVFIVWILTTGVVAYSALVVPLRERRIKKKVLRDKNR